jgi:chromate transporter
MGWVTFGGGYSLIPVIERELVLKRKWCTLDELTDYFAIGQVTPGVIAVNVSTFIGYKRGGIIGGIVATLGFVCPSLITISIIAAFLQNFASVPVIQHALSGVQVAVAALICSAVMNIFKGAVKHWIAFILFLGSCVASYCFKVSPVFIVLTAGIVGLLLKNNH